MSFKPILLVTHTYLIIENECVPNHNLSDFWLKDYIYTSDFMESLYNEIC